MSTMKQYWVQLDEVAVTIALDDLANAASVDSSEIDFRGIHATAFRVRVTIQTADAAVGTNPRYSVFLIESDGTVDGEARLVGEVTAVQNATRSQYFALQRLGDVRDSPPQRGKIRITNNSGAAAASTGSSVAICPVSARWSAVT